MTHIFSYGTLQFPYVIDKLIRPKEPYLSEKVTIFGFKRLRVKGNVYPGLVSTKN